jgi:hypothetical protein
MARFTLIEQPVTGDEIPDRIPLFLTHLPEKSV